MAYCTASQTIAEYPVFPQTTTVQRFTETSALISSKIPRAEAMINSYVGRRYSVPFTTVPPVIEQIAIDLTAYLALTDKFTRDNHNTNDWVELIGKDCKEQLELIRDRKIDLVDSTGAILTERTSASRIVSSTQDYQPFADLDEQTEWHVPSGRLNAIDRNG
jgi:phage gp36-like protein